MADNKPLVYGLYRAYAATTNAAISEAVIEDHLFIARTDDDAALEARRRCRGKRLVSVVRVGDADVI